MKKGTRRPRYMRKQVRTRNTLKWHPTPSVPLKLSMGEQNMITGPNAVGTAENENGRAKHDVGTRRTRHRRNEFERAKYENGTRRPRYRRNCVRARKILNRDPTPSVPPYMCPDAQNMKTGPDPLGIAENEFERSKHENGTRHHRYSRKRVRLRKT
jgi:hypothetical protein